MMKLRIVWLVVMLMLGSWSVVQAENGDGDDDGSDFEPPQGAATPAPDDSRMQSGPWNQRLMTAFSTDEGLTWTRTNQIVSDQADVPTAIIDAEGRIFLYFVTYYEALRNSTVLALSEDSGETWVYRQLDFGNVPTRPAPTDPAAVLLEDGRIRLYFIRGVGQPPRLVSMSAISDDGLHFTIEDGTRLDSALGNVFCAAILSINGQYHLFSPSMEPGWVHAVSDDGLNYEEQAPIVLPGGYFMGKGVVETPEGYRVFAHQGSPDSASFVPSIVSFLTTDGFSFTQEAGTRLQPDESGGLEARAVRNPSVIRLPDGRLMMFYVTLIPE
ncbi:MAG: exo-alpha-sialidase [Anaerolineae bacterium]